MFTVEERERVRDRVLELASADERVVAAAIVGSLAHDEGDEWSDLDLTFGVADGVAVAEVLDDFTRVVVEDFDAVTLVDLERAGTIYRVFLLPDLLQVDLSFTPAPDFRQGSPRFRLVFGTHKVDHPPPPSADDLFGWAVVFARHARVCIDRRRGAATCARGRRLGPAASRGGARREGRASAARTGVVGLDEPRLVLAPP